MPNCPYGFEIYLVNVKTMRTIAKVFVIFSEKLNCNLIIFLIIACATVKCVFSIDLVVGVRYNNLPLKIYGSKHFPASSSGSFKEKMEISFESCSEDSPGVLTITSDFHENKERCVYAGLLLHCTVDTGHQISNPWHNFVSDATNWRDENDKILACQNNFQFSFDYGYKTSPVIRDLIQKGAKNIWTTGKIVVLKGSPAVKKGLLKPVHDYSHTDTVFP